MQGETSFAGTRQSEWQCVPSTRASPAGSIAPLTSLGCCQIPLTVTSGPSERSGDCVDLITDPVLELCFIPSLETWVYLATIDFRYNKVSMRMDGQKPHLIMSTRSPAVTTQDHREVPGSGTWLNRLKGATTIDTEVFSKTKNSTKAAAAAPAKKRARTHSPPPATSGYGGGTTAPRPAQRASPVPVAGERNREESGLLGAMERMFDEVHNRLDDIVQRLDAVEQRLPAPANDLRPRRVTRYPSWGPDLGPLSAPANGDFVSKDEPMEDATEQDDEAQDNEVEDEDGEDEEGGSVDGAKEEEEDEDEEEEAGEVHIGSKVTPGPAAKRDAEGRSLAGTTPAMLQRANSYGASMSGYSPHAFEDRACGALSEEEMADVHPAVPAESMFGDPETSNIEPPAEVAGL